MCSASGAPMDLEVFSSPGSEEPMDLSLPQDRIRLGQREYNLLTVGGVQGEG